MLLSYKLSYLRFIEILGKIVYNAEIPSATPWSAPPNPSAPGTAAWIYDEIMRHIEPDLLTSVLPQLSQYYAKENPVERHARFSSYQRAFRAFDAACTALNVRQEDVAVLRTHAAEVADVEAAEILPPLAE